MFAKGLRDVCQGVTRYLQKGYGVSAKGLQGVCQGVMGCLPRGYMPRVTQVARDIWKLSGPAAEKSGSKGSLVKQLRAVSLAGVLLPRAEGSGLELSPRVRGQPRGWS